MRRLIPALAAGLVVLTTVATLAQLRTFKQTSNGNWETTLIDKDGSARPFVVVPRTKFTPFISVVPTISDAAAPRIVYRYVIGNEAESEQPITAVIINPGRRDHIDATVTEMPIGWSDHVAAASTVFSGISPGSAGTIEMESRGLPGVVFMDVSSVTDFLDIPEDLTELQREELDDLSLKMTGLSVRTIGPAIDGEGLSLPLLAQRVVDPYRPEFEKAKHVQAPALSRISVGGKWDIAREAATRLRGIAAVPVADSWQQGLSGALSLCAEVLLAMKQPVP